MMSKGSGIQPWVRFGMYNPNFDSRAPRRGSVESLDIDGMTRGGVFGM